MFCIFYALFGVPLILITVADIGKVFQKIPSLETCEFVQFLSENIIWLYTRYSHAKIDCATTS